MKLASVLLASIVLASCANAVVSNPAPDPGTRLATSSFDAARQCDVNSIATYKEQSIKDGTEMDKTDLEKMRRFNAPIDAGYRDMINACRAYAQCMHANKYDAAACEPLQKRWRESEKAFAALAGAASRRGGPSRKPASPPLATPEIGKPAPGFPQYGFTGAPKDP